MSGTPRLTRLQKVNVSLRAVMEVGIVAGLAFWGYRSGDSNAESLLLALGAPLIGFGVWGAVDFHQAGRFGEPIRLIQELLISGLASAALYATGQQGLGWGLWGVSIIHHALVYLLGERLLARTSTTRRPSPA